MARPILYITFDGVLQPLGFSQVVRVIVGLARKGVPYRLLSVERKGDLANAAKVETVTRLLSAENIDWTPIGVDLAGSLRTSGEAFARVTRETLRLASRVELVHARGYQAAAIARTVGRVTDLRYLFDARGSWIDERPDWFGRAPVYAVGKLVERELYRDASAVVTLTQLHASDVIDGAFGKKSSDLVATIPTCADYEEFQIHAGRPRKPADSKVVPTDLQARLRDRTVVAIVGALNRSYDAEATLTLARYFCEKGPSQHLLVLSEQRVAYEELLRRVHFPSDRVTFAVAAHRDMPGWLDWVDWSILLLPDVAAKRGSMPTKLAEFFAAGVRVVAYGCNAEMTGWVRRAGTGISLDDLEPGSLARAAQGMREQRSVVELSRAREITAPHFSLASGLRRYQRLLERVMRG